MLSEVYNVGGRAGRWWQRGWWQRGLLSWRLRVFGGGPGGVFGGATSGSRSGLGQLNKLHSIEVGPPEVEKQKGN